MFKIFLSYRRDDSAFQTTSLRNELAEEFGDEHVFMDVDSIRPGRDFRKQLRDAVHRCDVCLVMIFKDWLDVQDERGNRRLDNPADFVRIEIEAALERDIPVVPVLWHPATLPPPHRLPPSLEDLAYRHAVTIRPGRDLNTDIRRLIDVLHKMREETAGEGGSDDAFDDSDAVSAPSPSTALANPGAENAINIWDARTGTCRLTLQGHTGPVYSVGVTSDGQTVVSGSADNTVKLWDARTGTCRLTLQGHTAYVGCVALGPHGTVISGCGSNDEE